MKQNNGILSLKENKAAEWIFQDLAKLEDNGYIDALQITFIKGRKGQAKYYLKLGVNIKYFEEYFKKNELKESLIVCPYIYKMYNIDPYNDLSLFYTEKAYKKQGCIEMSYITLSGNLNIVLKIRYVLFKTFESIGSDDEDFEIIKNDLN